jgi:hypothetical protein
MVATTHKNKIQRNLTRKIFAENIITTECKITDTKIHQRVVLLLCEKDEK